MARVSFTLQRSTGGSGFRTDTNRTLNDAAITAASTTLTSATANFYVADVGQQIIIDGAGVAAADLDTTIVSVTNSTTVEVADAASTIVSDAIANIISDDVDGLRADGLQLAPGTLVNPEDAFFEVTSNCYGEVDLEWQIPLEAAPADPAVPTQYVVVYSPFGPPSTIPAGAVVAEGTTGTSIRQTGLPEGEFAYFSLFVRYQGTGGDDYYERLAQVSEMVPRNFGSTLDLWNRIPEYYREQDTTQGTLPSDDLVACLGFDNYGDKIGPLLTFLGIFGFEMDRVRSLTAHVARSKDPQHADDKSLDYLSDELGTILDLDDLGAARLRSLLNSIGLYRRRKGTEDGVEYAIKAVSGNDVVVDTTNYSLDVASGRVNYIVDPQNVKSPVDIEATRAGDDNVSEETDPFALTFAGVPTTPSAAAVVYQLDSPVAVEVDDVVSFSVHSGAGVLGNIAWARLTDSTTGAVVSATTAFSERFGVPYFDIRVTAAATVNVEFYVIDDSTFVNTRYLLEKNSQGPYFDGSLVRGGWLIDSSSISDYRWEGVTNNSVSLYSEDYERTRQILSEVYPAALPVTVNDYFTVTYDNLT